MPPGLAYRFERRGGGDAETGLAGQLRLPLGVRRRAVNIRAARWARPFGPGPTAAAVEPAVRLRGAAGPAEYPQCRSSGFDREPSVGAGQRAGEFGVEATCDVFAAADGDEVDVLAQSSVRDVSARAVPPMKWIRSPKSRLRKARVWEMRWSRSTCSAETPNCVATESRSSGSMVDLGPVFGEGQGGQPVLFGGEALQALLVTARVESRDGGRDVGFVVAEGRAVGQVEDCLLGRGHQHRP